MATNRSVKKVANELMKYIYADANCTLMAFTSTDRFLSFNSRSEFDSRMLHVANTTKLSEDIYNTIEKELASTYAGE